MSIGPESRTLIAYLLETEALPFERVVDAIVDARTTGRELRASLVARCSVSDKELALLHVEAERRSRGDKTITANLDTRPSARALEDNKQRTAVVTSHGGPATAVDPGRDDDEQDEIAARASAPDRYQLADEIGRGGMGRILRTVDTAIGRDVAMKVLLRGGAAPENEVRRFWTEVQATGQLEHPSIIPIHDVGRLPDGALYYVMKLLSGRTLASIIDRLRRRDAEIEDAFGPNRLLTAFQQIVYAVAFAHARQVIHRDIKPANIMIGRYGEAMLLDWGLAKLTDQPPEVPDPRLSEIPRVRIDGRLTAKDTASGTITGTPQYMSPEATFGEPGRITAASDVYSLGVVLYEILALEPPVPDLGVVSTIVKVRNSDFMSPRVRAPGRKISIELEELCMAALHRDPHRRPTAQKLADDLGRILEGTRERERKLRDADERLIHGRQMVERYKQLKAKLIALNGEAKALAKTVPPSAPVSEKAELWRAQDVTDALELEAIEAFTAAEASLQQALGDVPEHRDARGELAALYYARFAEAEKARDAAGQKYFSSLVRRYDQGVWSKVLTGDGRLHVSTQPPEAKVRLAEYREVDRVLTACDERLIGETPLGPVDVPLGSYVLSISSPGYQPLLRPVRVGRMESVRVDVQLMTAGEVGESFVYIPGGRCVLGGDPTAHGAHDRRLVHVEPFAIARFPVTCGAYLAFLNDLDPEAAARHVPRVGPDEGHYWRRGDDGRFVLPEGADRLPWEPMFPVFGVSYDDATAYVAWRADQTGERLRLPHEDEWEKAARGVDGRFFPWGDHFDPTFCKMKSSRDVPYPEPEAVGSYPTDCSPYGVQDMAGGVRELCFTEEDAVRRPVMRGGCWHDTGLFCRLAFRHVTKPDFVNTGLGFRLVKEVGPE